VPAGDVLAAAAALAGEPAAGEACAEAATDFDGLSCPAMAVTAYDEGSRSTYPTPRRVRISRDSLVPIFRRSTDT
jgi:hypothetical protein